MYEIMLEWLVDFYRAVWSGPSAMSPTIEEHKRIRRAIDRDGWFDNTDNRLGEFEPQFGIVRFLGQIAPPILRSEQFDGLKLIEFTDGTELHLLSVHDVTDQIDAAWCDPKHPSMIGFDRHAWFWDGLELPMTEELDETMYEFTGI